MQQAIPSSRPDVAEPVVDRRRRLSVNEFSDDILEADRSALPVGIPRLRSWLRARHIRGRRAALSRVDRRTPDCPHHRSPPDVAEHAGRPGQGNPVLSDPGKHSRRTAIGYLATMIVEVTLLDVGAIALLMIVPLSGQHGLDAATAVARGSALIHTNAMFYQFGEMTLAVGCVALCALLFRTRLIPRFLSIAGLIGYPILLVGAIAEVFGIHIGLVLTIPGMFFELVLPFWLFTKGFQPEAYSGGAARRDGPDTSGVSLLIQPGRVQSRPGSLAPWAEQRRLPDPPTLAICPYPSERSRAGCPQSQRASWAGGACWRRSRRHSRVLAC